MISSKERVNTEYTEMWIENGIVHSKYTEDLVITLDVAKKIVADRIAYCEGKDCKGFADVRNLKMVETEAMRYLASKDSYRSLTKLAVYTDNKWSRIFVNFWFKLYKPVRPTKHFTTEEEAYLYLQDD